MTFFTCVPSPLGKLLLTADGDCLTGLWFRYGAPDGGAEENAALAVFDLTRRWLEEYFSGREPAFTPPLRLSGTAFQREVWEMLRAIPYGETRTYGELAAQLARRRGIPRMSAQAVGGAVGRNPVSVIVPCHRVVGANGSLTGYGGGLENKAALLRLEGLDMERFFFPKTR